MHARVTTAQGRPGETDQMLRHWQEQILPAARQQEGFKGVLVLTDPGGQARATA